MGTATSSVIERLADLVVELGCTHELGDALARRGLIAGPWSTPDDRRDREAIRADVKGALMEVLGPGLSHVDGRMKMLSLKEASSIASVSVKSVRRWIAEGQLKASRVGSRWRVRAGDLEALVHDQDGTAEVGFDADREAERIIRLTKKNRKT